jgi:hypothetical protein
MRTDNDGHDDGDDGGGHDDGYDDDGGGGDGTDLQCYRIALCSVVLAPWPSIAS